jgi:hypothetical protein
MLAAQAHDERNPAQFIVTTFHPQARLIWRYCTAYRSHVHDLVLCPDSYFLSKS